MSEALPPQPGPQKRGPKPLLGEHSCDRIHDAALACFERQGIRETSMDDVARELGLSRTAIYHYFATKEDLLLEVVARQAGSILADLPHRLTAVGLERVAEATFLGVIGSLDNKYVKLMTEGAAAPLTGTVMETVAECSAIAGAVHPFRHPTAARRCRPAQLSRHCRLIV